MTISLVLYPFLKKLTLTLTLGQGHRKVKVIDTWVIACALLSCTLVPSMKSVGQIASEKCPVLCFLHIFLENLTLTFDFDLESRSSALRSLNVPY